MVILPHFEVCVVSRNNIQCNAVHRLVSVNLQQLPLRWCATSPTGPSTDLELRNSCPKMWTPSCAPIWFMLSPSSTTRTSWLPMNGMTRPCTQPSMAWKASKLVFPQYEICVNDLHCCYMLYLFVIYTLFKIRY